MIKRYFPIPLVAALFIASNYSVYHIIVNGFSLAWIGVTLATAPMLGFFMYVALGDVARTSRYLPLQLCTALAGVIMVLWDFQWIAFTLAFFVGLLGSALYMFWYVSLDRRHSKIIIGKKIPSFTLNDIHGQVISSDENNGRKRVWMFIRGNWCPLCVAQVKELAQAYEELERMGADVYLISSQPEKESQKLAEKFSVGIHFLVDSENQAAHALGIDHISGVPLGVPGSYAANTAMPTVVITDDNNLVVFASQTDDYRVRPEPEVFIRALANAQ